MQTQPPDSHAGARGLAELSKSEPSTIKDARSYARDGGLVAVLGILRNLNCTQPVCHVHYSEELCEIELYRAHLNAKLRCNLLVGQTLGHPVQDLQLPVAQRRPKVCRWAVQWPAS
jgi:hypothetical protein